MLTTQLCAFSKGIRRSQVVALPQTFSRHFSATSSNDKDIKNVTVFGSGLMGAGVVQVAASSGYEVTMVDLKREALSKGQNIISASLGRIAKKKFTESPNPAEETKAFIDKVLSKVHLETDANAAVKNADLVIEAIVENLGAKRSLFSQIDKVAPSHTIFSSNTSSLPITDIATATNRQDRFGGLHFFNPVPQMKLVEVIKTDKTTDSTFQALMAFVANIKKVPVQCKDTPGFIVNRLLVPYMLEALRMVERGDATPKDVDTAMKLGAGYPMGPFELADYVGLDTLKFITDGWYKESKQLKGDELVKPVASLEKLVGEGKLGRKSGAGFFDYSQVKK